MRTIGRFLQIVGIVVIAVVGYFTWFSVWGPNPNDRVGVALTPWMPGPVRDWGCGKLNQRFQTGAPIECSPVANAPTTTPAPTTPTTPGSGSTGGGSL